MYMKKMKMKKKVQGISTESQFCGRTKKRRKENWVIDRNKFVLMIQAVKRVGSLLFFFFFSFHTDNKD